MRGAAQARRLGFSSESRIVIWGQRERDDVRALAEQYGVRIERMEDGFLRSVGLGSDLATPASLVLDDVGVYYDPRTPSALEALLEHAPMPEELVARARSLRERIVGAQLSKYNVGTTLEVPVPAGRRVVLVPGQVEDDASIELGCRDVRTNRALLEAARASRPDAFLVYKPHPDVLSGNRRGQIDAAVARSLCDHIETAATLPACLAIAHEVHTLTSLVGFEALLRGLEVAVYGQPFYSGWGLTADRHPVERRTRRLSLDELVAGTLLLYPRYLNWETGRFTTAEATLERLVAERAANASARRVQLSWPHRLLRKALAAYRGITERR